VNRDTRGEGLAGFEDIPMESTYHSFKIDSLRREIQKSCHRKTASLHVSLLLKLAYYYNLGTLLELSNRMTAGRY
jgi:hypothetical protein